MILRGRRGRRVLVILRGRRGRRGLVILRKRRRRVLMILRGRRGRRGRRTESQVLIIVRRRGREIQVKIR